MDGQNSTQTSFWNPVPRRLTSLKVQFVKFLIRTKNQTLFKNWLKEFLNSILLALISLSTCLHGHSLEYYNRNSFNFLYTYLFGNVTIEKREKSPESKRKIFSMHVDIGSKPWHSSFERQKPVSEFLQRICTWSGYNWHHLSLLTKNFPCIICSYGGTI